jgi:non-specific protein-tyrosine kinase
MSDFPRAESIPLPQRDGELPITLSVHSLGNGPPVVFCHGFPELAYSWRHQLSPVAEAGFRAIAPDQRGYGASSRPQPIDAYSLTHLSNDMVGLLDALEIDKAIFVGHDWGGIVTWALPVLHPDRCAGIVGVCTPYLPMVNMAALRQLGLPDERLYILWFQKPGVAEEVLGAHTARLFDRMMRGGATPEQVVARATADGQLDMNPFRKLAEDPEIEPLGEPIVNAEELQTYIDVFETTGFRGGINWYRNMDRNAAEHPQIGTLQLDLPCLMITAEWDLALRPELAAGMPALCSDLETHMVERAGHWVQQEYPAPVNEILIGWLRRRFGAS